MVTVINAHMAVHIKKAQAWPRKLTRWRARAWPNGAALPDAAKRASLRRKVLTSGARSRPSTRPKSWGEYSLRPSGRLIRQSAMSKSVNKLVRRP